ncbi:Z1 domain-containing protein [Micavibrio aeruginosavorus]|uniref:DNA helicase n=1 Tax=Micavibrio aeruginosavorus (strain ARL-13) TaxID=856793 RepID=G2KQ79_MICAA|nr:Z1 domain-containing protein [Micavibrio aeruginosavorus]AEP08621.1 DNA helicase [Micavibrio aeruginosavorus ARL-13]
MTFDITKFKAREKLTGRYGQHIGSLKAAGKETASIETAVEGALANIKSGNTRSFVIYGEPQSGKTEMMIGLTARLLDEGHPIIIHLLNDSVDLLEQNLRRFKKSGIAPSPKIYKEILDPAIKVGNGELILFCKKNSKDLKKLIDKIGNIDKKVIIDDEADYASPNGKVNKGEKTKINGLITKLLKDDGLYIGVTATPARLDLNNTFENDHEKWVDFPPHSKYTGQNIFFPLNPDREQLSFKLTFLPDSGDSPKYIRDALCRFMINVAYLNIEINKKPESYSILIHTSGKKADHKGDWHVVESVFSNLSSEQNPKFAKQVEAIWEMAQEIYPGKADSITGYIVDNATRNAVLLLNSDRNDPNLEEASNPSSLFTVVIGGNIVSRGVTFNNLLSMFFTRDVQHKIQQDTYIQRARMFGARGDYLKFFELTIPEALYVDWHRCFVFHKLAIEAIKEGKGAPVWLADHRISPVSSSSIDRSTVSLDRGEMAFSLFDFDADSQSLYESVVESSVDEFSKLKELHLAFGDQVFPEYLLKYIESTSFKGASSVAIHPATSIAGYKQSAGLDKEKIERLKGFFGKTQMQKEKFPDAVHHLKVFYNESGRARLFYKFDGSVQFIKNLISQIERKAA